MLICGGRRDGGRAFDVSGRFNAEGWRLFPRGYELYGIFRPLAICLLSESPFHLFMRDFARQLAETDPPRLSSRS